MLPLLHPWIFGIKLLKSLSFVWPVTAACPELCAHVPLHNYKIRFPAFWILNFCYLKLSFKKLRIWNSVAGNAPCSGQELREFWVVLEGNFVVQLWWFRFGVFLREAFHQCSEVEKCDSCLKWKSELCSGEVALEKIFPGKCNTMIRKSSMAGDRSKYRN